MKVFNGIYRVWATILTAAVVLQIFFAGYGAFSAAHKLDKDGSTIDQDGFNKSFDPHIATGYFIWLGGYCFSSSFACSLVCSCRCFQGVGAPYRLGKL